MARNDPPLWPDLSPEDTAPLSVVYSAPAYRITSPEDAPRWTQVKTRNTVPCDECAAVQHETRGRFGPRAAAKQRRAFIGGPALKLCTRHAQAWHLRDRKDESEWK